METILQIRPVIQARGLRRTFVGTRGVVEAVAGIDLVVAEGAIFGLLGPNGAGKTTTLRMLATLLPPTAGEAEVAGANLRRDPRSVRRRIGYVGQQGGADHSISGRSELVFQGLLYGMTRREAERRSAELLVAFELTTCADRRTETWSGGQRRRLDVALGLVHRPALLFLDEPTTGLDPQSRARMWEEVRRLRDQGTTIFLTTHYLEEADALCDRLAIVDHGRIVSEGSPAELKREIAGDVVTISVAGNSEAAAALLRDQAFVRGQEAIDAGGDSLRVFVDQGRSAVPKIFRILDSGGVDVRGVSMSSPSLDDVFLRRTGRSLRDEAS